MTTASEPDYKSAAPLDLRTTLQEHLKTRPQNWFEWALDRMDLEPGKCILDLGCGSGSLWNSFAGERKGSFPHLSAVLSDISMPMLTEARNKLQADFPGFHFLLAEAASQPLRLSSFDCILAFGLLDHLKKPDQALALIRTWLKPGGVLYASTAAGDHLEELCRLVYPFLPEAHLGSASDTFTGENGRLLLEGSYSEVQGWDYIDQMEFPTAGLVLAYLKSEAAMLTGLEENLADLERHIEAVILAEGKLQVRSHKVLFAARA